MDDDSVKVENGYFYVEPPPRVAPPALPDDPEDQEPGRWRVCRHYLFSVERDTRPYRGTRVNLGPLHYWVWHDYEGPYDLEGPETWHELSFNGHTLIGWTWTP
jgi:hypothetical protein